MEAGFESYCSRSFLAAYIKPFALMVAVPDVPETPSAIPSEALSNKHLPHHLINTKLTNDHMIGITKGSYQRFDTTMLTDAAIVFSDSASPVPLGSISACSRRLSPDVSPSEFFPALSPTAQLLQHS